MLTDTVDGRVTAAGGSACRLPFATPGPVVGSLALETRAFLAPMAGITDAGMRRLARQHGAGLAVSEMVAASSLAAGDVESRVRAERQGPAPHAIQIAGCRTADMAEAARWAEQSGADLIDINMGCPAKRVTGGLAGSALMRDLDQAVALIRATVSAVKVPVTVKMRLGWDEHSINAPELARLAEAEGAQMIAVHGRTRNQFYQGQADWIAVRAVKTAVRIPVVVNGDCSSVDDAVAMLAASGADAVMVGRAAVGRPWLVGDIAYAIAHGRKRQPLALSQRLATAVDHYETLLRLFGVDKGSRHARKHLAAYARFAPAQPEAKAWAGRIVLSDSPREVIELLGRLFNPDHQRGQLDVNAA